MQFSPAWTFKRWYTGFDIKHWHFFSHTAALIASQVRPFLLGRKYYFMFAEDGVEFVLLIQGMTRLSHCAFQRLMVKFPCGNSRNETPTHGPISLRWDLSHRCKILQAQGAKMQDNEQQTELFWRFFPLTLRKHHCWLISCKTAQQCKQKFALL